MTCGMLCVMRRERRGVLHLEKYSPPKANCSGGKRIEKGGKKEEKKREKEKEKGIKKKDNIKEREPAVL